MIRDHQQAWAHFRALLPRVPADDPEVPGMDRDLAAFVAARPGLFEARLLEGLPELAAAEGPREFGYPTALAVLFDLRPPPSGNGGLDATLQALDPVAMLGVHGRARRDHLEAFGQTAAHNSVVTAAYLACRAGRDAVARAPLAPEFRDHVSALAFRAPLPDILGRDVHAMSADEVERRIADYMGLTPDAVARRLRRGGGTGGIFLGDEDRLGQTILDDARTLHALGVDRHALADRLDSLLVVGGEDAFRKKSWDVFMTSFMGHQDDPFHTADAYGVERRGATDFQILNHTLPEPNVIRGGDLVVVLIRRACFFEGKGVPYRLEPALAARVLGLLK